MSAFNTKTILYANPNLIPAIADRISEEFAYDGYEVKRDNLLNGGEDISVTKGGFFKAILGMKTALKVTLTPQVNSIGFEAGIGIFGQQVIPTIIMYFVAWPVLITQIWGLVKQASLDDKALAAAQSVIAQYNGGTTPDQPNQHTVPSSSDSKFCTNCGTKLPENARFCPSCGSRINFT